MKIKVNEGESYTPEELEKKGWCRVDSFGDADIYAKKNYRLLYDKDNKRIHSLYESVPIIVTP